MLGALKIFSSSPREKWFPNSLRLCLLATSVTLAELPFSAVEPFGLAQRCDIELEDDKDLVARGQNGTVPGRVKVGQVDDDVLEAVGNQVEQLEHEIPPHRLEGQARPLERIDRKTRLAGEFDDVHEFHVEAVWLSHDAFDVEMIEQVEVSAAVRVLEVQIDEAGAGRMLGRFVAQVFCSRKRQRCGPGATAGRNKCDDPAPRRVAAAVMERDRIEQILAIERLAKPIGSIDPHQIAHPVGSKFGGDGDDRNGGPSLAPLIQQAREGFRHRRRRE
jgi:hypothetical protein